MIFPLVTTTVAPLSQIPGQSWFSCCLFSCCSLAFFVADPFGRRGRGSHGWKMLESEAHASCCSALGQHLLHVAARAAEMGRARGVHDLQHGFSFDGQEERGEVGIFSCLLFLSKRFKRVFQKCRGTCMEQVPAGSGSCFRQVLAHDSESSQHPISFAIYMQGGCLLFSR